MDNELEFTTIEGEKNSDKITVYALSTCAFCKRAFKFLMDNSIEFTYIYVDLIPVEVKNELKLELSEKWKTRFGFPFVIINDEKFLKGFIEDQWEESFLKK